jgi:cytoskeleton protein RodZ
MGAYLRAARTEQSVSLERAAQDTKIKADFLMRMESDEFDFIAPAYARGFLRSYARYLGLEDQPFLDEFDRRFGTGPVESIQIVAAEKAKTKKVRDHSPFSRWTIVLVIAAGVLLALALIGIFTPKPARDRQNGVANRPSESPSPSVVEKKEKPSPTPSPTPTPNLLLAEGMELTVEAANGDCWVDVDTDGEDTFAEIVPVGESETFTATNEMVVVLGAPSSVELVLNDIDLGSPSTDQPGALKFTLPQDFGTVLPIPPDALNPSPSPGVTVTPSLETDTDTEV